MSSNGPDLLPLFCVQIIAFVKEWQSKNEGVAGVSQALVAHCIDDLSSSDNISCIVVFL